MRDLFLFLPNRRLWCKWLYYMKRRIYLKSFKRRPSSKKMIFLKAVAFVSKKAVFSKNPFFMKTSIVVNSRLLSKSTILIWSCLWIQNWCSIRITVTLQSQHYDQSCRLQKKSSFRQKTSYCQVIALWFEGDF